jgi:hypothetical protein
MHEEKLTVCRSVDVSGVVDQLSEIDKMQEGSKNQRSNYRTQCGEFADGLCEFAFGCGMPPIREPRYNNTCEVNPEEHTVEDVQITVTTVRATTSFFHLGRHHRASDKLHHL